MKKRVFALVLTCVMIALVFCSCNFFKGDGDKAGGYSLIYDKKYYHAERLYPNSLESNQYYIVFHRDGTGEWKGDGYGPSGAVKFRYILCDETVHCFFDGGNAQTSSGKTWNRWYWIGDGLLYYNAGRTIQYLNEEKLDAVPNFGK